MTPASGYCYVLQATRLVTSAVSCIRKYRGRPSSEQPLSDTKNYLLAT